MEYIEDFLCDDESQALYRELIDSYQLDEKALIIRAGGRLTKTDSFKILFADRHVIEQNYYPEEVHGKSYLWSGEMLRLKDKVESYLNKKYDLAMCIYYPDGNYFAPFHSDQETSGAHTILPSISLGEVRKFCFKSIEGNESYDLDLANGSAIIMGAHCQSRYMHSLLKNPKYKNPRINITFRELGFQ